MIQKEKNTFHFRRFVYNEKQSFLKGMVKPNEKSCNDTGYLMRRKMFPYRGIAGYLGNGS